MGHVRRRCLVSVEFSVVVFGNTVVLLLIVATYQVRINQLAVTNKH